MDDAVRLLFGELTDLSPAEREKVFLERRIAPEIRAEVESLLRFDAVSDGVLTERVSRAAEEVLLSADGREPPVCGPYRLVRLLGSGGMGAVYLAERADGEIQQRVAMKLLHPGAERPGWRERFLRERQLLSSLNHPAIARVIDAGHSSDGRPYLVMEHVEGVPIDVYAAGKDIREQLTLFLRVCDAVSHAHRHLIIHRDLKPSNILVDASGQPKLLDFGIAKLVDETGDSTETVERLLTPNYASPEQLRGAHQTTATDVYSLGAVLYKLLTGRSPHESEKGTAQSLEAIDGAREITAPSQFNPKLTGEIDDILRQALRREPEERYVSVAAFADDLQRHLNHEPIRARPDRLLYRAAKFVRRNRVAVGLGALALVSLAAGLVGTASQARRATQQAGRAERERIRADEQRDFAVRQLLRAEAINDLNTFLLADAAPSGEPFTVGELLTRAERIVEKQSGGTDETRVELLIAIGRQYRTLEEDDKARALLARAHEIAQKLPEPSIRARAACALADALAPTGEFERAEKLVQQALQELPDEPQFALHRVSCLKSGSYVARESGDPEAGIEQIEEARRVLSESRLPTALTSLSISLDLAESYRTASRYREASEAFEQAWGELRSLGRDETEKAGTLLNNWALALGQMGRPLAAEGLFRRALRISSVDETEESVSPMVLNNLARTLMELARLSEARSYAERACAKARRTGNDIVVNQSLLVLTAVYRQQSELSRAAETLSEVNERLSRMLPPGHFAFASLESEKALLAHARGDRDAALAAANRSVTLCETSLQRVDCMPRLLLRRSGIELDCNYSEDARTDAVSALELELKRAEPGEFLGGVGRAYLALGRALLAQGKLDEARAALASAFEHLEPSLGPNHPETLAAQELSTSP